MNMQELNNVIGRALSTCKKVTGAARALMREVMFWLNDARKALAAGDEMAAKSRVYVALQYVQEARAL